MIKIHKREGHIAYLPIPGRISHVKLEKSVKKKVLNQQKSFWKPNHELERPKIIVHNFMTDTSYWQVLGFM